MYVTDGSGARCEYHESLSEKGEKEKKKEDITWAVEKLLIQNPLYISSTHDAEQRNCHWFTL